MNRPHVLPTRRRLLAAALCTPWLVRAQSGAPLVEIYKSPACGCCKDWVAHLQANGFSNLRVHETGNTAVRTRLGLPSRYGSCHTATVAGYAIEGHVPAADIQRLGSPGMDGPDYDNRKDPYDVLLVGRDGNARVFSSYHK
jgi:hypothetical protein